MLTRNMTKSEIEKELSCKGDFVKIEYLTRFLKEPLSMDMKKFVFLKLAETYEKTGMLTEAAKNYENAETIAIPFSEKIKYFMKAAELYIKAGDFERTDEAMKKAMQQANSMERDNIYYTIKDFYKKQAQAYENILKRANAVKIYEKLLDMKINEIEKKEIKEKLLDLYGKLGKIKEYFALKGREQ